MLSPIKDLLQKRWKHPVASFGIETESVLSMREGERSVITYTPAADKIKVFSALIRKGIGNGDQVEYTYPDKESESVRAKLKEHGINVEKYEKNGTLLLKSLTERYMTDGKFDKERGIREGLAERAEGKRRGYKHFWDIEDDSDFSFIKGQWQTFIDYWDDPRWGVATGSGVGVLYEPFIIELTAVNVGGMSETMARDILKAFGGGKYPPTRLIDLLEYADAFSKRIDMSHQELSDRKLLLEFDPASDYEKIVKDFAKEALANLEPIYIFTSSISAVHTSLAEQHSIRFFLMSVSATSRESTSNNEITLPTHNTPLILDSLNEILRKHTDENVLLVFDNLSGLITLVGFDKAYRFLLCMVEMLSSKRKTALFLLNIGAHEPKEVSQIRGLFDNILTYEKNQLTIVKSPPNPRKSFSGLPLPLLSVFSLFFII